MAKLALDTATEALSVTVIDDADRILGHTSLAAGRQHGERLVPVVAQLLEDCNVDRQAVDSLYVGVGPGSYTGVRIGVTLAKTWADSLDLALYQMSSLALLAAQASVPVGDYIIPLMDARRLSAYTALYQQTDQGLVAVTADCHADWQTWLSSEARQYLQSGAQVLMIGQHLAPFAEAFGQALPDVSLKTMEGWTAYPHTDKFQRVAHERVAEPALLEPVYGHLTLAEQEWLAKEGGTSVDHAALIHYYS